MRSKIGYRKEIHSEVDKEKENANLDEIQRLLQIDLSVFLFLVQEHGHDKEHALSVKKKPNNRAGLGYGVQHKFGVHPPKVGHSPHSHADANENPEGLTEAMNATGRAETHGGRQEAAENLEKIAKQGTQRTCSKKHNGANVEGDHGKRHDSEASRNRQCGQRSVLVLALPVSLAKFHFGIHSCPVPVSGTTYTEEK